MNTGIVIHPGLAEENGTFDETQPLNPEAGEGNERGEQILPLAQFIEAFGSGLLESVQKQNPPVYQGQSPAGWDDVLNGLMRKPFEAQREAVLAMTTMLLGDATHVGQPSCLLNAEMGTGKTIMGIASAAILHQAGFERTLVISPPHLVYKWRREIIQTVPHAKVWVLNGPDTLRKLLTFRAMRNKPEHPEFFILGRVRMRMGFLWKPSYVRRLQRTGEGDESQIKRVAACTQCGTILQDGEHQALTMSNAEAFLSVRRMSCDVCRNPLWSNTRGTSPAKSRRDLVFDALQEIPSIGQKTADRLINKFGEEMLANMLEDNFHNFINLMDDEGDLIFNDRQAKRMERFLGNNEISFGQGGYQATEFIKRYLPKGFFGSLIVDEGHEYKNEGMVIDKAAFAATAPAAQVTPHQPVHHTDQTGQGKGGQGKGGQGKDGHAHAQQHVLGDVHGHQRPVANRFGHLCTGSANLSAHARVSGCGGCRGTLGTGRVGGRVRG